VGLAEGTFLRPLALRAGGDAALLGEALELYDTMGAAGVRHFATEQLVAGLVFSRTGRLQPAEPWFVHYWGNKDGFNREIARRLQHMQAAGMNAVQASEFLRGDPIRLPPEVRPTRFEKLRRWLSR
jgi:hypothetical protein